MFARFCRLYLMITLCCFIGVIMAAVAFTRSPAFPGSAVQFWDVLMSTKAEADAPGTDVLLVGDSSLLNGVRPDILDRHLDLNSYNLGLAAFAGYDGMALVASRFVERNGRPRLIVVYLSATSAAYSQGGGTYEHAVILMRYLPLGQLLTHLAERPADLPLVLKVLAGRLVMPGKALFGKFQHDVSQKIRNGHGYLEKETAGLRITQLSENCHINTSSDFSPEWRERLERFKTDMNQLADQVIVYLAPMPRCESNFGSIANLYRPVIDNDPRQMDSPLFVDYTHTNKAGAEINSRIVADDLKRIMTTLHPGSGGLQTD